MSETGAKEDRNYTDDELPQLIGLLPPIPKGWLRLTHFTNERAARNLIDGEDFDYGKRLLGQTTDPFSDSDKSTETLMTLLQTERMGPFGRGPFGNWVVLIDMDNEEYRLRNGLTVKHSPVPHQNIVGFIMLDEVNGQRRYKLFRNARYDPKKSDLEAVPPPLGRKKFPDVIRIPTEDEESSVDDVW